MSGSGGGDKPKLPMTWDGESTAVIPYMRTDIADMNGLMELGDYIFDGPEGAAR